MRPVYRQKYRNGLVSYFRHSRVSGNPENDYRDTETAE